MPNNLQLLRSTTPGNRPPNTRLDGEPYVNFADRQFGVMQGGAPIDLIGVGMFNPAASYVLNNAVNYQGELYTAKGPVAPGPWNAAEWNPVAGGGAIGTDAPSDTFSYGRVNATWGRVLPLAGGTVTGALTVNGAVTAATTLNVTGNAGVSGTLTTTGYATFNGGGAFHAQLTNYAFTSLQAGVQIYSAGGMTYPAGTLELYNVALRSSYYVGQLYATPNSFGATPSLIWGAGFWGTSTAGGASYDRTDSTNTYFHGWEWGVSSLIGYVYTDSATVYFANGSDIRLKENVRPLAGELDIGATIDAIEPVAFEWTTTPDSLPGVGFIAQDLVHAVPEAVYVGDLDPRKYQGDEGFISWGVDPVKLIPYLVAELKALRARVATLEAGAP
jgi:hypothetical protein